MKRKTAIILLLIILSIVVIILYGCGSKASADKVTDAQIISYVNDNYELLKNFQYSKIEEIEDSGDSLEIKEQKEKKFIKEYFGANTLIKSVYLYNENILQFTCESSGILDTGTYIGFYYSKNDEPFAFEFNNLEFTEVETDVFVAQDEKGSKKLHNGHKIQTAKIRDNWYSYIQNWY